VVRGAVVGIDVGRSALKAVLVAGDDGRVLATACAFREEGTPELRAARVLATLAAAVPARTWSAVIAAVDATVPEGARTAVNVLAHAATRAGVAVPLRVLGGDRQLHDAEAVMADPSRPEGSQTAALELLARTSGMLPLFFVDLGGGPARLLAVTAEDADLADGLSALAGDGGLQAEEGCGLTATGVPTVPACRIARIHPEATVLFEEEACGAAASGCGTLLARVEGARGRLPPSLAAAFETRAVLPEAELRGRASEREIAAALRAGLLVRSGATLTDCIRLMGRTGLGEERAARFAVLALARAGGLGERPPEMLVRQVLDAGEAELARALVRFALVRSGERVAWLEAAARGSLFAAALEPGWRPPHPAPLEVDFRLDWPLAATGGLAVLAERPAMRLDTQRLLAPHGPFATALAVLQALDEPPPFPRWP